MSATIPPSQSRRCWLAIGLLLAATCACSPAASPTVTPALTFGHRQINQLLADRPNMRGVLDEDHPVRKWIVDGMNGKRLGHRVYWNADSPRSGRGAEHAARYYHYPAQIYITGGTEETPVEKWASLVYELFNMENSVEFDKLRNQGLAGEIDRDEYAMGCVKLEFAALKKIEEFFDEHSLPASANSPNDWYDWVRDGVGSFEEYAKKWEGYSSGPGNYKYFRDDYDENIAPWIGRVGKAKSLSQWTTVLSDWLDQAKKAQPINTEAEDEN